MLFEPEINVYVDVVLPLNLKQFYTYTANDFEDELAEGKRVLVDLKGKVYTAIIRKIHNATPNYTCKPVIQVLDQENLISDKQLKLWDWIANYYMAPPGLVMAAALPAAFRISSETQLYLAENYVEGEHELSNDEFLIVDALFVQQHLTFKDISKILQKKQILKLVDRLLNRGIIEATETLVQRYKPKLKAYIQIAPAYASESGMEKALEEIQKSESYTTCFLRFLQQEGFEAGIAKENLTKIPDIKISALDALIKKGIFIKEDRKVSRLAKPDVQILPLPELSAAQKSATEKIKTAFEQHTTVLLHGVTSSGKTEVYVHLIDDVLKAGKQVLFLVPEISLTSQLVIRITKYFGEQVGVYHSRFNEKERVEVWKQVQSGGYKILLGPRSALFLPFQNLGLIIVDEEHEQSYKQQDTAPQYNGRDLALVLANIHGAKTLLGSATPSFESYFNAQNKKYGLVTLSERFGNVKMPNIILANIAKANKEKSMRANFTPTLFEAIGKTIARDKQLILMQNRRGYATLIECDSCGWVPQCKNCDISLTYHKPTNNLRCHYCGYAERLPKKCTACGSAKIEMQGLGTQKVEEDLKSLFPELLIDRMDYDTTRSKKAFQHKIERIESGYTDVLVGTKMVSKGLDFEHVHLVGVINADPMIYIPDFRSHERAYQMLTQVAGRAGRRQEAGEVIIQTRNPSNKLFDYITHNNFEELYRTEMEQRANLRYPPFTRLIHLTIKHRKETLAAHAAQLLSTQLKTSLGDRVLGPTPFFIPRLMNFYLYELLLKIERNGIDGQKLRAFISNSIDFLETIPELKSVEVLIDVDPA